MSVTTHIIIRVRVCTCCERDDMDVVWLYVCVYALYDGHDMSYAIGPSFRMPRDYHRKSPTEQTYAFSLVRCAVCAYVASTARVAPPGSCRLRPCEDVGMLCTCARIHRTSPWHNGQNCRIRIYLWETRYGTACHVMSCHVMSCVPCPHPCVGMLMSCHVTSCHVICLLYVPHLA